MSWHWPWDGETSSDYDDKTLLMYAAELYELAAGFGDLHPRMRAMAEEIGKATSPDSEAAHYPAMLAQLGAIETRLYDSLPSPYREAWYFRLVQTFNAIASPETISASAPLTTLPPADAASGDAARNAARDSAAPVLITLINRARIIEWGRNSNGSKLARWLLNESLAMIAVLLVVVPSVALGIGWVGELNHLPTEPGLASFIAGIALIMSAGYLGAVVSTIRRLQGALTKDDGPRLPLAATASLLQNKMSIRLGLFSGCVFAFLAWAVFAGGLGDMLGFKGGLFPVGFDPGAHPKGNGPQVDAFAVLAHVLGLAGPVDLLRMLVWAFLSGFAERILPDAIDRVVQSRLNRIDAPSPSPQPATPKTPTTGATP